MSQEYRGIIYIYLKELLGKKIHILHIHLALKCKKNNNIEKTKHIFRWFLTTVLKQIASIKNKNKIHFNTHKRNCKWYVQ